MQIEQMISNDDITIREVLKRLERNRCKTIYIVRDSKLIGSVSDGDVRRFLLNDCDVEKKATEIMNDHPKAFYENQEEQIRELFEKTELYSVPIINYNREITAICFRNNILKKNCQQINIPVVIMAGGKGTRLYPYTKILPKALVPIGDIPIIEHIINRFHKNGSMKFYLIVNHKKNMIKSYFEGNEHQYEIHYVEEEVPLGTGGGLSLLEDFKEEDFVLSNCDILIDADYQKIYDFHRNNHNFITIVAAEKIDRIPYGVIEVENGCFVGMQEKPECKHIINTGMYIVNRGLLKRLTKNKRIDFTELIYQCHEAGEKIGVYTIEEKAYMDMGQLEEMEKMKEQLGYKGAEL